MTKLKMYFLPVIFLLLLSSCSNLTEEAEKRINELRDKTESLDSLLNREVEKVWALDSLINRESEKVQKLDSLINNSASKIDSVSKEKIKLLEELLN